MLYIYTANDQSVLTAYFQLSRTTPQHTMQCAAVRKKKSVDRCLSLALKGHTLCGIHARARVPTLWATVHKTRSSGIVAAQAVARGWLLRKRLHLGGPGVLRRKDLANDEDLVTCETKDRQHPLAYFSFEENGKVWWFDFDSLWRWTAQSHEPSNPYTKVPLSMDTRKRLRAMWAYQQRHRLSTPEESTDYDQRVRNRWNILSQLFVDHGFVDVHPSTFLRFTAAELQSMFVLLERDIRVAFSEKDPGVARAIRLCRKGMYPVITQSNQFILWSSYTLLLLLTIHKDPYVMTFSVLSALYRC